MVEASRPEFRLEDLRLMAAPGYPLDAICDSFHENRVIMGLHQASLRPLAQDTYEVSLRTTRGNNQAILTASEGKPGVVLWIPGGMDDLNGPAGGVYADLAGELQAAGVTSLRMAYRDPGSFHECVLDALAWLCFLKGSGAKEVALVGNTLGAAVAIPTTILHPQVKAMVAISPQRDDTQMVDRVTPRPLLVIHGSQDALVPVEVARELYRRAGEPKELVIYPNGGHSLVECRDALREKLGLWLAEQLGAGDAYREARNSIGAKYWDVARSVAPKGSGPPGQMVLTRDDIVGLEVDAIVSTTGTSLDLKNSALAGAIVDRGGWEIQEQLWAQAPLYLGEIAVTGAGRLKAKYIIHAITGGAGLPLTRDQMVRETTRKALQKAEELVLRTIALPAIGTGGRGFPIEKAAQIIVATVAAHLAGETSLEKVMFAVVSDGVYRAFESQLNLLPG